MSSSLGTGDPATDALIVDSNLLSLTKEFTDDPVAPGGTVNLRFSLTNLDGSNSASAIAFTDDLGDALAGLVPSLPVGGCGGTASLTDTDTIDFSGGSRAGGGSCSFDVPVSVPSGALQGTVATNTTSQVAGTIDDLSVTGDPASDDLLISSVSFTKAFDGPTFPGGNPVLTFTITNLDTDSPVTDLAFTDDLDAALSGLEATGLPASNVCG